MNPGATTRPEASMVLAELSFIRFSTETIFPLEIPTSACLPEAPVPSTTNPPFRTISHSMLQEYPSGADRISNLPLIGKPAMSASRLIRLAFVLAAAAFAASAVAQYSTPGGAPARTAAPAFEPTVGQEGKDVVWVPTPQALVDKMLDMAKVTPKDYVIDLGSGDGRTVITAAKRGAKAQGIEYNPDMVELSKRNAAKEGVSDKATFAKADLFQSDFSQATVITMFLLPSINIKLRPKILDLKPGTRIVSNSFDMEDWKADETATASGCDH